MTINDLDLNLEKIDRKSPDFDIITSVLEMRRNASELLEQHRYMDALERIVAAMRELREFSDFENTEFRALLIALLFDLAEVHYELKDYRQSEKEIDVIFRVLETLVKEDPDRFGHYHVLAMELSTRILRSRKKAMEMLVKQQLNTGMLYEKVNSGVAAATDKLVDSLRNEAQLLASAGDYKAAMKFYAEAIKLSKKRAGKVNRKEIKMTVEMAEIMMRVKSMRPRARRLLNAVLPHAISLELIEMEEDILALIEMIDNEVENEPRWKMFMHRLTDTARRRFSRHKEAPAESAGEKADLEAEANAAEEEEKLHAEGSPASEG
ncbi:MAG: hypothetical protein K2O24_02680 [Muribaculaceae bacterium]|nr:hypothetical protein [Muribaculaceae bacterium]